MDRPSVPGSLLAVAFAALLCSSGVAAATGFSSLQTGDVETDSVAIEADIDADGDARWTIEYRVALDNENTTEAFESLQRDIERNTSDYRAQFASRMRTTVASAENATGREMAVENVTVEATTSPISGEYGVVRYGFDWVGFADVAGDQLAAGEALAGLFLDADTRLTFRWPEGYVVDLVEPKPDRDNENSVTWTGPRDFDVGQPRVIVREANASPPWGLVVGIILFGGGGAVWYFRRERAKRAEAADAAGGPSPSAGTVPSGGTPPPSADEESEPDAATAVDDASGPTATAGDADDTPEELLSPEERVLRLLEENGGRVKQKVVTEELDWSAARTSQVVGDLRDEGRVESFRLGRENVLKFPDDEE